MPAQEVWKSMGGHLEDLRATLIRMLLTLMGGFCLAFVFYEPLFQILTASWKTHTSSAVIKEVIQQERITNTTALPVSYILPQGARLKGSHLEKSGLCVILAPHESLDFDTVLTDRLLILGPLEGLLLAVKVSFWIGAALTCPVWGWFFLQFVMPGLKQAEKALLTSFISWSLIWISAGAGLAYFLSIPLTNSYLEFFNASIGQNAWTLTHYVDYVLLLYVAHLIAFELGSLLLWLVHFQWISSIWLVSKRRYAIVIAFIIGALLTPPDVMTQCLLALPLIGFYECAIIYGKWKAKTPLILLEHE